LAAGRGIEYLEVCMSNIPMYHEGSRQLQDQFEPRKLADRLVEVLARDEFTDDDRAFIESRPLFFLATADAQGQPDCSHKGGLPGFVRVVDRQTIAFPSYDGNGMFKSLGNLLVNPHVGLLFIDFESPRRLRVNGEARVHDDDPLLAEFVGAQLMVRVRAKAIFPNCPRYIHKMQIVEQSVYAPCEGRTPPVPKWKQFPEFRDVLPPGDPAGKLPEPRG
jgi:predicted pyridoxine 5'-phosphate oxidase superfamily flavin-nucleotide-binding protein